MARIELVNLKKTYGHIVAVRDLSCIIEDGEFVVFVGPSGCGKTTTLRLIAGFEEPDQGEIRIDGKVVNDLEPRDRGLGMVFQTHALFPHKTVAQNIEFGLRMKKVPRGERARRVREVAEMVRLTGLLDKFPGACSGGESQRVALARTLVTNPSTFLLDEPLSSLDAKLRRELRAECDRLHEELKKTFIFVTHDQEEAMTLADRIVVMRDGDIEQIGSPMEIYSDPVTDFVADFFGSPSMNLIAGEIDRAGGTPQYRSTHLSIALPDGFAQIASGPRYSRHPAGARSRPAGRRDRGRCRASRPSRRTAGQGYAALFRHRLGTPVRRDHRRSVDGRDGRRRPGRADPDPRLPISVRSGWTAHRPRRRARRTRSRATRRGARLKGQTGPHYPPGTHSFVGQLRFGSL